ncbi:MAG: efflux RND transporter periplasmic adaptor subunit [Gammaproteobacteria bacterium]|nr:efflux RND transporter periplasmic adaptor subunit [Gammaproteobacteria bacterium]
MRTITIPPKLMKFALPLGILLGGLLLVVLFIITADKPEPLQSADRAPVVSVQVVEKAPVSPMLRIFGEVESPKNSILTAAVEADIISVEVLEGDAVKRGQALIVMDDGDAELAMRERAADLAEIEALIESDKVKRRADRDSLKAEESLLELARKKVARAKQLAQSQLGSEAALDDALRDEQTQLLAVAQRRQAINDAAPRRAQLTARRDKAAAAVRRAERERERARVAAPFDGRVTEIMAAPGDRAARGEQLVQLYDDSQLEVRAQVPDVHVPLLRRALDSGRKVSALVLGEGGGINLRLHRLSANVDEGQGGIDAFFRAEDGARLPVLGDTVEVRLELPPLSGALAVSPDSLYGNGRVYVVRDGVLQSRPVRRLGQRQVDGRQMLIVSGEGFEDGDEILSSRLPQAVSGLRVKVVRE